MLGEDGIADFFALHAALARKHAPEDMSRGLRAALDAGRPIVADVECLGLMPAGELRHPAVKGWTAE